MTDINKLVEHVGNILAWGSPVDKSALTEEVLAVAVGQAAQTEQLTAALKASTDRLTAVWQNTGSMGAKAQVDANLETLATLEATK